MKNYTEDAELAAVVLLGILFVVIPAVLLMVTK